jgi:hypothetical protein
MTVNASWSCLGLGTCVWVGDPAVSGCEGSPNHDRASGFAQQQHVEWFASASLRWIIGLLRSARSRRHAPGDSPNKARQLTCDRGSNDIGWLAGAGELTIARA